MKLMVLLSTLAFSMNVFASNEKTCSYKFDLEKSEIKGTGYKLTEKTAVSGQFTGFKLNKEETANKREDLFKNLVVTVDLMTLDSGNALRDKNLRETLFANIVGDSVVTVSVKKMTAKTIETDVKLNDKVQKVVFTYSFDKEGYILAQGTFDVLKFAMGDQVASLKKRCGSLHTGSDGKSVTWTDFNLSVKAKMTKKCPKKS